MGVDPKAVVMEGGKKGFEILKRTRMIGAAFRYVFELRSRCFRLSDYQMVKSQFSSSLGRQTTIVIFKLGEEPSLASCLVA